MGCFDFTFADNGSNLRGSSGWYYLTNKFAKHCRLPNPLRFLYTNEYGDLACRLCPTKQSSGKPQIEPVYLDVYAIYGAMIYMDMDEPWPQAVDAYLDCILRRDFDNPDFADYEHDIRKLGIDYYYRKAHNIWTEEPVKIEVQKLANQRVKRLTTNRVFCGKIPLVLSHKKLPAIPEDDLADIAQKWGFVSASDPNQGFGPTKNLYCIYNPLWGKNEKLEEN